MAKRIVIALIGVVVVVAFLGGVKALQIRRMIQNGNNFVPPPETVSTAVARRDSWESLLTSVGSVEAVHGVTVTAELSAKIQRITFEPGVRVEAGALLVQQDVTTEMADLRAAKSDAELAKINLQRSTELLGAGAVSQSDHDSRLAQFEQAVARVENIESAIQKKTIRAPFAGRLGIRQVNLGQVINAGEAIVSLQSLDPIFVNFWLPQQEVDQVKPGLVVQVTSDAIPGRTLEGKITAINPEVDASTRNVGLQATLENPEERLRPGMFVSVAVVLPAREDVLAIPATAVLYAPYGDQVFRVVEQVEGEGLVVRQQFVRLGRSYGDFVAVEAGVEEGDTVVSTGVFKLRNGQSVVVDNTLSPEFVTSPTPPDR